MLTNIFAVVIIAFYLCRLFDIGGANSFAAILDSDREAGFLITNLIFWVFIYL